MTDSPKQQFVNLITKNCAVNGFDELTSKIIGILYIEVEAVSLEDLANKTGYSLSAVSTAMKPVIRFGLVKRIKKPKSRKAYFYMEKDLIETTIRLMRQKYEVVIQGSKKDLPKIISSYPKSKEELSIVEGYYKQVIVFEKILGNMLDMVDASKSSGKAIPVLCQK